MESEITPFKIAGHTSGQIVYIIQNTLRCPFYIFSTNIQRRFQVETCTTGEYLVLNTARGEIRVNRNDIIHFPDGIIGFEDYTEFAIFDIKGCEPFKSMLSVKEGGPDFVVLEPLRIFEDYSAFVSNIPRKQTDLGNPTDMVLLSIVTLAEKPENITVNLRGPIFLNLKTRNARQVVLSDDRCKTKVPLLVQG